MTSVGSSVPPRTAVFPFPPLAQSVFSESNTSSVLSFLWGLSSEYPGRAVEGDISSKKSEVIRDLVWRGPRIE